MARRSARLWQQPFIEWHATCIGGASGAAELLLTGLSGRQTQQATF
jgi:hypothetical protein